jgi:tRNA G18 (ribose-2'-O)-methylase SpoU
MSTPKIKSVPDFSETSTPHKEAIKDEKYFFKSPFNVKDEFKSLSNEEIKKIVKQEALPYAILVENWINDYNLSCSIRNANGFGAEHFYYFGNKKIDRRGACGTHNYLPVDWISSEEELLKLKERYEFIGVDNIPGSIPLQEFLYGDLNKPFLFIFGEEGCGLTPKMQELCSKTVYIPMQGSIRSLNCATASGILMHSFSSKIKY